jgi:cytokinin dehydrogenase
MKMRWLDAILFIALLRRLRGDCMMSGDLDKNVCQRLAAAEFEGPIIFKGPSIAEASKDFGGIYHNKPAAVLSPASAEDISKLIRIAATSPNLTIAARGIGHSIGGQAMARNGIVLNMTSLKGINIVYKKDTDVPYVDAMAGELWVDVLRATVGVGLAPRSWTDYLDLSIGGTLSNAGVSGQTYRFGPQISNVLELEIVTGKGDIIKCSAQKQPDLYFGALGGLGQFGVITKARIILQRATQMARQIRLVYWKLEDFMHDQELLISLPPGKTFDYIEGFVVVNGNDSINGWPSIPFPPNQSFDSSLIPSRAGPLLYVIEVAKYYDPVMDIDKIIESLLSKLCFIKGLQFTFDRSYFDFLYRVHAEEVIGRESGIWYAPHAWLNLFVPKNKMVEFDSKIFKNILIKGVNGLMLLYPMKKSLWDSRTSAVIPEEDIFYAVSLLRFNKSFPEGPPLSSVLDQNNAILEACKANGIPVKQYLGRHETQKEWEKHFGEERWKRFLERKRLFDPIAILSPGQNIFPRIR